MSASELQAFNQSLQVELKDMEYAEVSLEGKPSSH